MKSSGFPDSNIDNYNYISPTRSTDKKPKLLNETGILLANGKFLSANTNLQQPISNTNTNKLNS